MQHRTIVLLLGVFSACAALAVAPRAAADPITQCIADNERSLDLRERGLLLEARSHVASCAASTCPDPIRQACGRRMTELSGAIPSVVFAVKDAAGHDRMDVNLAVDGQPAETLGVTARELDPGRHTFRFDAAGGPSVERVLVLREGEKEKHESVVLGDGPAPPGTTQRTLGWIVGAAGVVALGVGGALAFDAKSSYAGAMGCSGTTCTDRSGFDASNAARDLGNVATVVLITGGAVAAGGIVLLLTAPRSGATDASQGSWSVGLTTNGALLRGTF